MLAHSRHHTRARRGIVLVLVLAMLGLLALIGVTFATLTGFPDWETGSVLALFLVGVVAILTLVFSRFLTPKQVATN